MNAQECKAERAAIKAAVVEGLNAAYVDQLDPDGGDYERDQYAETIALFVQRARHSQPVARAIEAREAHQAARKGRSPVFPS